MGPRQKQPLDAASAQAVALRALGRRELSARELRSKLEARGLNAAEAANLVQDLRTRDLQSDDRYAELLVRTRVAQHYGPLRIRAELATRGVDETTITSSISDANCDWVQVAVDALRRRHSRHPVDAAESRRQWAFLAGRGFESGQIRMAVARDSGDSVD